MKIVVPLFRKRVSLHFGSSSRILLLETKGTAICEEAIWDLGGEGPIEIARRLVALGVEELICGGIQSHYKDWLAGKGIVVILQAYPKRLKCIISFNINESTLRASFTL